MRHTLVCHPEMPCDAVRRIDVDLAEDGRFSYVVTGNITAIRLPPPALPVRTDGLWQTTCFEFFARPTGGMAYREFNFSPSGAWAAYDFDAYRDGMRGADIVVPEIVLHIAEDRLVLTGSISIDRDLQIGLSAVIEEKSGIKSYWALAHPAGKPDFHHSDCFVIELAASKRP
jgi:hypothetical protein